MRRNQQKSEKCFQKNQQEKKMSNNLMERLRQLHSEMEISKEDMLTDWLRGDLSRKESIVREKRTKQELEAVGRAAREMAELYRTSRLRHEIDDMSSRNHLNSYYTRLSDIRRYHREVGTLPVSLEQMSDHSLMDSDAIGDASLIRGAQSSSFDRSSKFGRRSRRSREMNAADRRDHAPLKSVSLDFSGAEWDGQCLDLNDLFTEFINTKVFNGISRETVTVDQPSDTATQKSDLSHQVTEDVDSTDEESKKDEMLKPEESEDQIKDEDPSVDSTPKSDPDVSMNTEDKSLISSTKKTITEERVIDYATFLERFADFWRIPNNQKGSAYVRFYRKLLKYLRDFYGRLQPLVNLSQIDKMAEEEFELDWNEGKIEGWQKEWKSKKNTNDPNEISLQDGRPAVAAHPPAHHHHHHHSSSLYCYTCTREFRNESVMSYHMKSKKHLKKKNEVAKLEYLLALFLSLLSETLKRTKEMVEFKQTLSWNELVREMKLSEKGGNSMMMDEDRIAKETNEMLNNPNLSLPGLNDSNPKNVPLDFDGKPIPYWLFKFRQLNRRYICEICCGQEYRGPRAFERHFQEWKHASNLRKLGVPNTKDFYGLTEIAEVLELKDKMQKEKSMDEWDVNEEQEWEDSDGNVFKKSTYDQLRRQGIL